MYSYTVSYAEENDDESYSYHRPRVMEYVDEPDNQRVATDYLKYAGYKDMSTGTTVLIIPHVTRHSQKLTTNTLIKILGEDFDLEKLKLAVKMYGDITNDMWYKVR